MSERIGTGVVVLGLLAAACGGVDEREAEALIDEIEATHAEIIETMEENAALAIERAGKPLPGRGNPGEEILARRVRETEEEWAEELGTHRHAYTDALARWRDGVERGAWEEVFNGRPLEFLRAQQRDAQVVLGNRQARLEREASGETARALGAWAGVAAIPDPPAEPYERPSVEELLGLEPAEPK